MLRIPISFFAPATPLLFPMQKVGWKNWLSMPEFAAGILGYWVYLCFKNKRVA